LQVRAEGRGGGLDAAAAAAAPALHAMIACGRNRDVFLVIGPASSRTERPAGTPAAIHDPNTV
jgi:hypothetical protein